MWLSGWGSHGEPGEGETIRFAVNGTQYEIDLEPVSHTALRSLLDVQRTVRAFERAGAAMIGSA